MQCSQNSGDSQALHGIEREESKEVPVVEVNLNDRYIDEEMTYELIKKLQEEDQLHIEQQRMAEIQAEKDGEMAIQLMNQFQDENEEIIKIDAEKNKPLCLICYEKINFDYIHIIQ